MLNIILLVKSNLINIKTLLIRIFLALISLQCYANSTLNQNLQELVSNFQVNSGASATLLSINYPNNQIVNFVSGTVTNKTLEKPYPTLLTTSNLFQIGSITKSYTAVMILQLEAENKLTLNDSISDLTKRYGNWLPKDAYQLWQHITVKQLLNMTSGIFDYTEEPNFMNDLAKYPSKNWTTNEILRYAYLHKPYFKAGTSWHYSNTTYNILGLLIEKITEHSFANEINSRIFRKYALNNTFYLPYKYPPTIMKRMAHGYALLGGGFSPPIKSGTDTTFYNMSAAGPSGAIVANSIDITKWITLLFTGKILPKTQLTEMLDTICTGDDNTCNPGTRLLTNSHSQGFSLGLSRMYVPQLGIIWVYIGSTAGYYSAYIWSPKKKVTLAITVNATTTKSKKILKTLVAAAKLI